MEIAFVATESAPIVQSLSRRHNQGVRSEFECCVKIGKARGKRKKYTIKFIPFEARPRGLLQKSFSVLQHCHPNGGYRWMSDGVISSDPCPLALDIQLQSNTMHFKS